MDADLRAGETPALPGCDIPTLIVPSPGLTCTFVTCAINAEQCTFLCQAMSFPNEFRKSVRYPLHLPVTVKLGTAEISARSENICRNGILLSSDFLMLKGSSVELAVHFAQSVEMGASLMGRGKVLRVEPNVSGGFVVAIGCVVPFRIANPARM
jgi:hypothetical protein